MRNPVKLIFKLDLILLMNVVDNAFNILHFAVLFLLHLNNNKQIAMQILKIMTPTKQGQIAKFHTPLQGENPEQLYVVLEVILDDERPRAEIQALNTGLALPPTNTVRLTELEVVEVSSQDLMGHHVTINKSDFSQVNGKVISVSEQKINLELSKGITGVETNVYVTILDKNGKEHIGTLFVN